MGVDVRVMLSGAVVSGSLAWPKIGPFRANNFAASRMRGWLPVTGGLTGTPPLRDRVLLDWTGTGIGVNHQKIVLMHLGGTLTAYCGGIDLVASRFDAEPHHTLLTSREERWGWHDGAARLTGPAATRVWELYRWRWQEVATMPRRYYYRPLFSWAVLNPPLRPRLLPPAPSAAACAYPNTAVRVLRSISPWKVFTLRFMTRVRWQTLPKGGVHEVFNTLSAAIRGASGTSTWKTNISTRCPAVAGVTASTRCSGMRPAVGCGSSWSDRAAKILRTAVAVSSCSAR